MVFKNVEFHYSHIINKHTHAHTRKSSRWLMNDLSLRHPPLPPLLPPLLGSARDGASWRLMVSSRVMSAGRAWNFAAGSIPKRRRLCRGLSERPNSLCRHVRGYRSAPLPGQPVLDEADADTRTDAGMLWFRHVLLEKWCWGDSL